MVTMAEKEGKTVELLVVPGVDPFEPWCRPPPTKASRLVTGVSAKMDSEELARRIGIAWEKLPEPRHRFRWRSYAGPAFRLRQPRAAPAALVAGGRRPRARDVAATQREQVFGSKLHHRDVVGLALRRLSTTSERVKSKLCSRNSGASYDLHSQNCRFDAGVVEPARTVHGDRHYRGG